MKCVWMRPLVLQPQMKNVANSTQKSGTRATALRTVNGDDSKDASPALAAGAGVTAVSP